MEILIYIGIGVGAVLILLFGTAAVFAQFYKKVVQGTAIIRTGVGKTLVSFKGMFVIPILHRYETMDISVKRIEIDRTQQDGLICKDNIRADIKVAFFVRVNKTEEMVMHMKVRHFYRNNI